MKDDQQLETTDLPDVELFSTGTWRGDTYTEQDLDEMVRAAQEVPGLKRPIRLGHTEGLGQPAVGWVENLRREGTKLFGDLKKVPKTLANLIQSGAYRKRSAEVYWDYTDGQTGRVYPRVFRALALLGADLPAVNNLEDIVALYEEDGEVYEVHRYDTELMEEQSEQEESLMKDRIYAVLGLDAETPEDEAVAVVEGLVGAETHEFSESSFATQVIKQYQDSDEFKALKADAEAGRAASLKVYEMEKDAVIKTAVREGRILPADTEKWSKRYDDAPGMTSEIIAELPAVVQFGEIGDGSSNEATGNVVAEIHAYQAEHGVNYEDAAMVVLERRGEV